MRLGLCSGEQASHTQDSRTEKLRSTVSANNGYSAGYPRPYGRKYHVMGMAEFKGVRVVFSRPAGTTSSHTIYCKKHSVRYSRGGLVGRSVPMTRAVV